MVAEQTLCKSCNNSRCSLAKISMVAEQLANESTVPVSCSLAKISMVAEPQNI